MLCERCNKNPATVHLKTYVNGIMTEKHLCQSCAKETGQLQFWNLGNPLSSFFETLLGTMELKPTLWSAKCRMCNLSFDQFRRGGQLGCPACYTEFREELNPIIRRIQGDVVHRGKVPKRAGGTLSIKRKIEQLRNKLNEAVSLEEYEKAAEIRDEIKRLEKEAGGEL